MRTKVTNFEGQIEVELPGIGSATGQMLCEYDWWLQGCNATVNYDNVLIAEHLEVDPASQGNGYGKRLLKRLIKEAHKAGCDGILGNASPCNDRALSLDQLLKFYTSLGFKVLELQGPNALIHMPLKGESK